MGDLTFFHIGNIWVDHCRAKKMKHKEIPRYLEEYMPIENKEAHVAVEKYVRYCMGDETLTGADMSEIFPVLQQKVHNK